MVGYNFRKIFLIALCASTACTVEPAKKVSTRTQVRESKAPVRSSGFLGRISESWIQKVKKFASLDYLRHCDCPHHKKNQTLKNQIRRHPGRLGIYVAAGIGTLYGAYRLFRFGSNLTSPNLANQPTLPTDPYPLEDSTLHDLSYEILLRQKRERQREMEPFVPAIPVDLNPMVPVNPPVLVPVEMAYVIAEPAVEHHVEVYGPPLRQNPVVTVLPAHPLHGTIINVEAPVMPVMPALPVAVIAKPDSPVPVDEERPRQRPRASSKGKEEESDGENSRSITSDSQNNSLILISSEHGKLKAQLSQPLQNLIHQGTHTIQHEQGNPFDPEELILLGAACNHALITNDQDAIALFRKDQPHSVRALTWYYYALAAQKEQFFQEGTFLIVHPRAAAILDFINKDTLETWLPSLNYMPNAYKRISSHFDKLMKLTGIQEQHYGIDINHLPTGKQTLLFGHVNREQNIIFIKPENHGTNVASDIAQHVVIGYSGSVATKVKAAATGGPSGDDAPEFRKERVPTEILNLFKVFNDGLLMQSLLSEEHRKAKYTEAQARGIAYMHAEISRCRNNLVGEPELLAQADALLAQMNQYDHLNVRFGRESVLTELEFDRITPQDYALIMQNVTSRLLAE